MISFALALFLTQETGTLSGRVTLPEAKPSKLSKRYTGQSGASEKEEPDPSPAVVYIEGVAGSFAPPAEKPVIEQKGVEFRPRVLPVLKGTIVEFPNRDEIYHNVFSLSKAAKFDLGRYSTGESKSVTFDAPGVVKIYCEIHEHMKSFVVVLDNPYFTTTDAEGNYTISGIPPGDYTLVAWHENAKEVRAPVKVEAGAATQDVKFGAAIPAEPAAVEQECCGDGFGG